MRLFNHLLPWRTDMPDQPDDITRLRKSHYALEDLPETMDDEKLKAGVDKLLATHPKETAIVYLHAFNSMNGENWTNLDTDLHEDDRLELKK